LLAPPKEISKKAAPLLALFKIFKRNTSKKIFERLMHYPAVEQIKKEGNVVNYKEENLDEYIYWQFLKIKDEKKFIRYFLDIKNIQDYLKTIEDLANLYSNNNFFNYYLTNYIRKKPKLIIYGKYDHYLKPFLPFNKKKIERFYKSFGNAKIYFGKFSHVMIDNPTQQSASVAVKNKKVIKKIIDFIEKN
jgi:hypothetical protein